jgi:hypothetical protein
LIAVHPFNLGSRMSYARWIEGDIYLYHTSHGYVLCDSCPSMMGDDVKLTTWKDVVEHVKQHIATKHNVPGHTLPLVEQQMAMDPENKLMTMNGHLKYPELYVHQSAHD